MTKSIDPPPNPDPGRQNPVTRLVNKLKSSPKALATGAIAIAACGGLGYWGTQVLVNKKLPPFLENQIGKFIKRPIYLGEVKGFSLGGIEFGKTVLPSTATDPDKVEVDGVKVGFNIFPVLFRRTLPVDIALVRPNIYLEQEQNGEWINLDFLKDKEKKEPPVFFALDIDVEQAKITAVPYQKTPLKAQVDGNGRFNQKQEVAEYDLDLGIEQAKASIKGETRLKTGTIDTKLQIKDFALANIATLLPNAPVKLDSGSLEADLDINIPSLEEINAANIQGVVNLQNVTGAATDLDAPVSAKSKLNFGGRNADIKQTQAYLGDITAQIGGQVNLDRGYNLDLRVLPFQLASLPSNLTEKVPVNLAGEVEAVVGLRGAIKDPKLKGNINNTQTVTVDKTPFKQIKADFSADLNQVVLENMQLIPMAGGRVTAQGKIETNLNQTDQTLEQEQNKQNGQDPVIDLAKMPLGFSFRAELPTQKLVTPYYQLPQQVVVGNLEVKGQINGTVNNPNALVNWNIPQAKAKNLENISGSGELAFANNKLSLQDTEVTYGEGKANIDGLANLHSKRWQANLKANSLNLTPFWAQVKNPNLNLNRPVGVTNAKARFQGRLDQLDLDKIQGTADLNLNVNGGDVAVNSQLSSGNVMAKVIPENIKLEPFITSLPVAASLQSGTVNASGKLKQLLAFKDNPDLNSFNVDAALDFKVDGEALGVTSQINSGKILANVNSSQINLNHIAPNLPIPASIQRSKVTAFGELKQLLTYGENSSLSTFNARFDGDLGVAQGTVKAIANLNNNQWEADVNAANISSQLLIDEFAPKNLASVSLDNSDNINAQTSLTGNIQPLLDQDVAVPLVVKSFAASSGVQEIKAKGGLTFSNITSNLDIANTNLDVIANFDFDQLPIQQIIAASTQDKSIAEQVRFAGKAAFEGKLLGKQLISAANKPGNLNLAGDLELQNFAFNNIAFDTVMPGKLKVQPGQAIALKLQGERDIIAASAVPCIAKDCKLPYLPNNLELRQGEGTEKPVVAMGKRTKDVFSLDVDNFPLTLLNLAPAKAAGIKGALGGETSGNVDLNLYTLAAKGKVAIKQPGLGYLQAKQLDANFNYDPAKNIAEVTNSSLNLGNSQYNLNAALNLKSGAIDGKLDIPEAYIQDALTTLRWFTIEDVTSLFNIPDYGAAETIQSAPATETVNESIARKLNQLRNVNNQIQTNAAQKETSGVPTELDIQGKYNGLITLGGTIQTPKVDFNVEGANWQWQPIQAYPDIVSPLGLVIEEPQYISIPQVLLAGKLQGTMVDLAEAKIMVQEAALSLKGKLSPQESDVKFAIANLTVDNIGNFVSIPVDLAGEINSLGTIKGSLDKPQLEGKIAFTEGAFNGNVLPAKLAGNFDYDGSQLGFKTTAPDSIRVEARVPYPIIPGKSDRLTAKVNVDKEAFVLLEPFSQNYLSWTGGEGDAQLEANARLDPKREDIIYDLDAQGVINLEDANVALTTPFFAETFVGTGKITLNNQIVNVENLNAIFAEKDLAIAGRLPILKAVNNLDNPLTIDLPPGEIKIKKLYQGGVAGKVVVTGASLEPIIGGEVTLEDGKITIPKTEPPTQEEIVQTAKAETSTSVANSKALPKVQGNTQKSPAAKSSSAKSAKSPAAKSAFVTALQDFQVNLKDFKLEQSPVYKFQLEGGLNLNGTVDQPSNIRPDGKLKLTRADVDLLSSTFNLARDRENTITFTPQAGVFNPALDIVLKTEVNEIDEEDVALVESGSNEIPDPFSRGDKVNAITVSLAILGETAEILPNLAQNNGAKCDIRPVNSPLVDDNKYYSSEDLNLLTECFNNSTLVSNDNSQIINSPAVELTSVPSRSQGELVSLFGKKFLAFAEQVGSSSQEELFSLGVNHFVIAPIQSSVLYRVDDTVVGIGKKVGLDYMRVIPNFEGIVELNQDSTVRSTYNYALQEVKFEYEKRF